MAFRMEMLWKSREDPDALERSSHSVVLGVFLKRLKGSGADKSAELGLYRRRVYDIELRLFTLLLLQLV